MNEPMPADVFVLFVEKYIGPEYGGPFVATAGHAFARDPGEARKWSTLGDLACWAEEPKNLAWMESWYLGLDQVQIVRLDGHGNIKDHPTIPATLAELLAPAQAAGTPASG